LKEKREGYEATLRALHKEYSQFKAFSEEELTLKEVIIEKVMAIV
jgi:hypothetical protein